MANVLHLQKLKEGVRSWNAWRQIFRGQIDLINADLSYFNLYEADLRGANLSHANLLRAYLSHANLCEANLSHANLDYADLSFARLNDAKLSFASLEYADLTYAELLRSVIKEAHFYKADLSYAKLSGADLSEADLGDADLRSTDLRGTNLSNSILSCVQLLESNLSSATLTGACVENWNINSATNLEDILCEYVYLESTRSWEAYYDVVIVTSTDRRPRDPNTIFAPGEFAKLFQAALETVDLVFIDGIDWKAFFQSFQELRAQYDDELSIQAIERKSGGAFVVRLETPSEVDKTIIESKAKELYEQRLQALEARYQTELHAQRREIEVYKKTSADMTEIAKLLASRPITVETTTVTGDQINFNNNIQNSSIANFANLLRDSASQNASQFSQAIGQNADDIARLLNALKDQAQQFPVEQREKVQKGLNDLERNLTNHDKDAINQVKAGLLFLLSAASAVIVQMPAAIDFANDALDLAERVGLPRVELIQSAPEPLQQQLLGNP